MRNWSSNAIYSFLFGGVGQSGSHGSKIINQINLKSTVQLLYIRVNILQLLDATPLQHTHLIQMNGSLAGGWRAGWHADRGVETHPHVVLFLRSEVSQPYFRVPHFRLVLSFLYSLYFLFFFLAHSSWVVNVQFVGLLSVWSFFSIGFSLC